MILLWINPGQFVHGSSAEGPGSVPDPCGNCCDPIHTGIAATQGAGIARLDARKRSAALGLSDQVAFRYASRMCRSIRQLRRAPEAGSATTGEAEAAALQYVRKISGYRAPAARNAAAFDEAVATIAAATEHLLATLGTSVEEGPDPFADPVTRRAILEARGHRGAARA